MISAILEAGGKRTARYTSPHVTEYRERITRGSEFFDSPVYIAAGEELRELARALEGTTRPEFRLFDPHFDFGERPSFFELLTLYFFLCARQAKSEVLVVETGMGGRLDATNIVDPLVSVITSIELEHTEFLGNTLGAIAGEKAGIIKPGRPLILMGQEPETLAVFEQTAAAQKAPLRYFPALGKVRNIRVSAGGTRFTLDLDRAGVFPGPLDLSISIPGEIQAKNAGLAALAAKTAFPGLEEDALRRGLRTFSLPGRFERIGEDPVLIIDGAHTPQSVRFCLNTFSSLYGAGGILIFGCAAGKDAAAMARFLTPHFSRIIITTPGSFKKSDPPGVFALFREEAAFLGAPPPLLMEDTKAAIAEALRLGREWGLPVLGTGSFYLAAEIRETVLGSA
jgi:dihydrofolate synthase/folylpolyglutamate synthase